MVETWQERLKGVRLGRIWFWTSMLFLCNLDQSTRGLPNGRLQRRSVTIAMDEALKEAVVARCSVLSVV